MKTKSKSKLELEQVVKTEQGKHVRKKDEAFLEGKPINSHDSLGGSQHLKERIKIFH